MKLTALLLASCLGLIGTRCAAGGTTLSLLGELPVNGSMVSMRATPDGHRLLLLVQTGSEKSAQIQIVDASDPKAPVTVGHIPLDHNADMAVSPDGKRILLAKPIGKREYNKPIRYDLAVFDISNPVQPQERWRNTITAVEVALAPDAGRYASSQFANDKEGTWQVVLGWPDGRGASEIAFTERWTAPTGMHFSASGEFLAYGMYSEIQVADLRKAPVAHYDASRGNSNCFVALLDSGYLLTLDSRTPRFGVYTIDKDVPRVGRLEPGVPFNRGECPLGEATSAQATVTLEDGTHRVYQVEAKNPRHPRLLGPWWLPPDARLIGADAAGHIYAQQVSGGQSRLRIYDLRKTVPTVVDWKTLETAHSEALKIYKDTHRPEYSRAYDALRKFEEASPAAAIEAPADNISPKVAAAILNDYGFLLWKARSWRQPDIEGALRRASSLDPMRALAHLNLADVLRQSLPNISNWPAKHARMVEAEAHYRQYLSLGGKSTPSIEAFLQGDVGAGAPDICDAIVSYANNGRLGELNSDVGIDVPKGKSKYDFVFTTEGTAHVPTFYGYNAADDKPVEADEFPSPGGDSLWGGDQLGLVVYRNGIHILHYRDVRHPVASSSLSGDQTCEFKVQTVETIGPKATEPELCEQLLHTKGPESLTFAGKAKMASEDVASKYSESSLIGTRRLDLENDGHPINVGQFGLSSGAGAGCEETFFDALDSHGKEFIQGPKQELLMKLQQADASNRYPVLPCGNQPRFFNYRGSLYFETKPATWPPVDDWDQYHRVTRVKQGKVVEACDFRFSSKVTRVRAVSN